MQSARKQKTLHETYEDLTNAEKENLSSILNSISPRPAIDNSTRTQGMLGRILGLILGLRGS